MKLNLGSGQKPQEGFEGVDRVDLGQEWVVDLERFPWPWKTSSVETLFSSHLVEHVADLVAFMDEAWRILAPGGLFGILHPYGWSDQAIGDPTHRRMLVELSWYYFDAQWRDSQNIGHYAIAADFEVLQTKLDEMRAELCVTLRARK